MKYKSSSNIYKINICGFTEILYLKCYTILDMSHFER
nr:MAG TPA: hypothetical protein [Caudoviricetes sp.]